MIRIATQADAAAIGQLKIDAWRAAYTGILPADLLAGLDPEQEARDWADYLADLPDDHRLWIVEHHGAVAGYCRTGPADNDRDLGERAAEIHGLYLRPALIGAGLGRRLFTHAVADLSERGFQPLCVYAYAPNVRALRFYESAGFRADGVTRLDEEDGTGVREVRLVHR